MGAHADAALAARALAAYAEMFVAIASVAPQARIERRTGLLLVGPGAALPRYNSALLTDAAPDAAAVVATGDGFFRALGTRWMLTATGAAARRVDIAARAAGMAHQVEPGMVLLGDPATAAAADALAIAPVADVMALWTFDRTMQTGFGSSVPIATPAVMDSGALLRVPALSFFLGRVDGEPAGTATLFVHGRVACVADISVVPAQRRRGFGAALTAHAVAQGRAQGCDVAYLEASALGEPVYRRLGFREAVQVHGWLSPG